MGFSDIQFTFKRIAVIATMLATVACSADKGIRTGNPQQGIPVALNFTFQEGSYTTQLSFSVQEVLFYEDGAATHSASVGGSATIDFASGQGVSWESFELPSDPSEVDSIVFMVGPINGPSGKLVREDEIFETSELIPMPFGPDEISFDPETGEFELDLTHQAIYGEFVKSALQLAKIIAGLEIPRDASPPVNETSAFHPGI